MINGAIIDDIDYFNRLSEMLHVLTSTANRDNDQVEGFDNRWDSYDNYEHWGSAAYGGLPPAEGKNDAVSNRFSEFAINRNLFR